MSFDSDDDDIFIEFQLKPVNSLTRKDALRIKEDFTKLRGVSLPPSNKQLTSSFNKAKSEKSSVKKPQQQRRKSLGVKEKTPQKTIDQYFGSSSGEKTPLRSKNKEECRVVVRKDLTDSFSEIKVEKKNESANEGIQINSNDIIEISLDFEDELDTNFSNNLPTISKTTPAKPYDRKRVSTSPIAPPAKSPHLASSASPVKHSPLKALEDRKTFARIERKNTDDRNRKRVSTSPVVNSTSSVNTPASPVKSLQEKLIEGQKALLSSPKRKRPDDKNQNEEVITLSPGIKKNQNRFKSVANIDSPKKNRVGSPPKRSLAPALEIESTKENNQNSDGATSKSSDQQDSSIDAKVFGTIIQDVMKKQLYLKETAIARDISFTSLLSDFDMEVMRNYVELDEQSQMLYMRMFFRRSGWHRVSKIKYGDLSPELINELNTLVGLQFLETDIERDDIKVILDLLKASELQQLSKTFNYDAGNTNRKEVMIDGLLSTSKRQRSVLDMFKSRQSSRAELIKKEAVKVLGTCFRLNSDCFNVFSRVVILFSLFHDIDDESKRSSSQRLLMLRHLTSMISFVPFTVLPTVIFKSRDDFLEYVKALSMKQELEDYHKAKMQDVARESRTIFRRLLADLEFCERVASMPTFLRKYNAGSVHAYILTQYCELFKRKSDKEEVTFILSELLEQNIFNVGARGKWYELLCQLYHSSQNLLEACNVVLAASKDKFLNEVQHLTLKIKGQQLLKVKKNGLKNAEIREELDDYCTMMVQEPASIEINAKAVPGNAPGSKLCYEQNTANGKRYSSVEEQAIYYYKANGFTEGVHAEGFIVSSLFFLIFFDIVYDCEVPGVFQSQFQERPLDLFSSSFYENRKEAIDSRMQELLSWTPRAIADKIEMIFAEYMNTLCVITWKEFMSPRLLCEIIECIGMTALSKIFERFIHKPRLARSGFPDLTMWNKETKKCKFVEVKSPNDRLSTKQRVWMDYLKKAGIDCEVCNVKNTASKKPVPKVT